MPSPGAVRHRRASEVGGSAWPTRSRNAPTVLNTGLYFKQHWDGRFANVEEQAKLALLSPAFGSPDYPTAMARLKAIPGYTAIFQAAFPGESDPVSEDNWAKAIGAYERTLVSPSRFDEYLGGKSDALSSAERKGLRTFIDTGCVECHKGPGLGGLGFRKFGVFSDYWKATGSQDIDKGRFGVTNNSADIYKFKVAGLRNVAMTPPYFHDGTVGALPKAVRIMAKVQLDADLSDPEVDGIVTFLGSLTGTVPQGFERAPCSRPAASNRRLRLSLPRGKNEFVLFVEHAETRLHGSPDMVPLRSRAGCHAHDLPESTRWIRNRSCRALSVAAPSRCRCAASSCSSGPVQQGDRVHRSGTTRSSACSACCRPTEETLDEQVDRALRGLPGQADRPRAAHLPAPAPGHQRDLVLPAAARPPGRDDADHLHADGRPGLRAVQPHLSPPARAVHRLSRARRHRRDPGQRRARRRSR